MSYEVQEKKECLALIRIMHEDMSIEEKRELSLPENFDDLTEQQIADCIPTVSLFARYVLEQKESAFREGYRMRTEQGYCNTHLASLGYIKGKE